jgi:hypothetical protein
MTHPSAPVFFTSKPLTGVPPARRGAPRLYVARPSLPRRPTPSPAAKAWRRFRTGVSDIALFGLAVVLGLCPKA